MEAETIAHELIERKTWSRWFWDVMNYQIFEVDNHPFTASKIVVGLILLALGYWVSKRASRAVERRLLVKFDVDESLRYALGRFSFYLFLIMTWLFTLHILNVPITIFAVAGSAVAIGLGFGSQNIIYNFISGLLVMLERPIRVGDYIEMESIAGTVDHIGIRSTVIISPSNARIIVPNTHFLEKTVINWTLGDELQAGGVRLGVDYGSDLKLLDRLCRQAAADVSAILKDRPVGLTLSDYSDNALVIEVGFWCFARSTGSRKSVESDFRIRLLDLLKTNNISLRYPPAMKATT